MRTVILTLVSLSAAGLLIAVSVIFLGLFNVSGSSGHWPLTGWVLHTTYENSVRLRAPPPASVPELSDDSLVQLGAAHYEQACAMCHGEPGGQQAQTLRSMLPPPPPIKQAVDPWQPNELFWIIKHGVKMSGMPHWPTQERDDDIWPVVAFLLTVPALDPVQYRALLDTVTSAEPLSPPLEKCIVCHGLSGDSGNAHVPRLDILDSDYIQSTLKAYRSQRRNSGIMQHAASVLDDRTIESLADFYSSAGEPQPFKTHAGSELNDPESADDASAVVNASVERGRQLATGTQPEDFDSYADADVPACNACHGPWPEPLASRYPAIAGQSEVFLLTQLQLWTSGQRGGTELARMMHKTILELDSKQMQDIAAYYSHLPDF